METSLCKTMAQHIPECWSVQGSLIQLAIVQASSLLWFMGIPLEAVHLDHSAAPCGLASHGYFP